MYNGETKVSQDKLPRLMKVADSLKIKGLCSPSEDDEKGNNFIPSSEPPAKRKRYADDDKEKCLTNMTESSSITNATTIKSTPPKPDDNISQLNQTENDFHEVCSYISDISYIKAFLHSTISYQHELLGLEI